MVLYPAGIASVLVVLQQACFKWYNSGSWQGFTQLTWQKSNLPPGKSVKLQQRGSCQVHVLIPQKTWRSLPLTCQLVKQGTRAQRAACIGCKNFPDRRQSKHLRWENHQSLQVTTKLLGLQLTTKKNVNQSLYLVTYKPHTHSSAHKFYHTSYIPSATLAQKVSLNAQELKWANANVFTQGYRGVARKPAEY